MDGARGRRSSLLAAQGGSTDDIAVASLRHGEMPDLAALPAQHRAALDAVRRLIALRLERAVPGRGPTAEEESQLRYSLAAAAEHGVPLEVLLQVVRRTLASTIHHRMTLAGPERTEEVLAFSARAGRLQQRVEQWAVNAWTERLGTGPSDARGRATIADALLDGRTPPPDDLAHEGRVVVVVPGDGDAPAPLPGADGGPGTVQTVRHGADVVLVPLRPRGRETAERIALQARRTGRELAVAVPAATPADVPRAYERALALLRVAPALRRPPLVITPGDALPEQLLATREDVVERLVAMGDRLAAHPALLETLAVLLDSDLDRAAAAAHLHVQPRTLTQRIGRIREVTGYDPRTGRGGLMLGLALAARALPPSPEPERTGGGPPPAAPSALTGAAAAAAAPPPGAAATGTGRAGLAQLLDGRIDGLVESAWRDCERDQPWLEPLFEGPQRELNHEVIASLYRMCLTMYEEGRGPTPAEEATVRAIYGFAAQAGYPLHVELRLHARITAFLNHGFWRSAGAEYAAEMLDYAAHGEPFDYGIELMVEAYRDAPGVDLARELRAACASALLFGDRLPPTLDVALPLASAYVVIVLVGATLADLDDDPRLLHLPSGGTHVVLVPLRPDGCAVAEELAARARLVAADSAAAAVVADRPEAVPAARAAAQRLLDARHAVERPPALLTADDAVPEDLLVTGGPLTAELAATLDPLAVRPGLLDALTAFLAADGERTVTAARLGMDRRTLASRMNRITELTGHDPRTTRGAQVLALGLAARRLLAHSALAAGRRCGREGLGSPPPDDPP